MIFSNVWVPGDSQKGHLLTAPCTSAQVFSMLPPNASRAWHLLEKTRPCVCVPLLQSVLALFDMLFLSFIVYTIHILIAMF